MKDEDLEKLSLDSFDEDEFMLNDRKAEPDYLLEEDNIIDTPSEKDFLEEVEIMEEIIPKEPIIEEVNIEKNKNKKEQKEKKTRKSRVERIKKEKKKAKGFKFPKDRKGRIIYVIQAIFCLCSIAFIIGCCIHYGSRLIKYYRIYNPKTEGGEAIQLIGTSLTVNAEYKTEGDGLYRIGGASVYKGENVNNYLYFANQMWRVISINGDGSLEVTTDQYINALNFNDKIATFDKSDIKKYLNDKFLSILNKDLLTPASYCLDEAEDIASITCNNIASEDYVRLLGIPEFLNSKIDENTYLYNESGYWLYNSSSTGAWHTSGSNVSLTVPTNNYLIKPVVRIKNSLQLLGGTGTKEDPYLIEKDDKNLEVGKYVKLGEDTWIIYETNDETINLALSGTLKTVYRFSNTSSKYDITSAGSLGLYLNTVYLQSLSYKDMINEGTWYIGSYDSKYENVYKENIKAKVGIFNVADLKIGNSLSMYYLLTPVDKNLTYFYSNGLVKSKITLARNIKPTININKKTIGSGEGTLADPYILEA